MPQAVAVNICDLPACVCTHVTMVILHELTSCIIQLTPVRKHHPSAASADLESTDCAAHASYCRRAIPHTTSFKIAAAEYCYWNIKTSPREGKGSNCTHACQCAVTYNKPCKPNCSCTQDMPLGCSHLHVVTANHCKVRRTTDASQNTLAALTFCNRQCFV